MRMFVWLPDAPPAPAPSAQISGRNKLPNLTFTILSPSGETLRFAAGPVQDMTENTTRTALRLCMQHARELCEVYKILGMQV